MKRKIYHYKRVIFICKIIKCGGLLLAGHWQRLKLGDSPTSFNVVAKKNLKISYFLFFNEIDPSK